ncbi:MAG: glutamine--tRNA ligase/YqeY domain fusion protein [Kiritimatiellae bacterium]|nr:glutamine--tRNA ligase/YqeY domain fusion protein [Kiritimatiellia bacterium]
MTDEKPEEVLDFIREIVADDLRTGKHAGIVTRFPPEPNGYLHIGHAKAICLDFGVAQETGGRCHLRLDDTNPAKENEEYVESIKHDIQWLGFDWGENLYFASDYFEQMYEYACELIRNGLAYVCDLSVEDFKEYRGVPTRPGKDSPCRCRSVEENLELFRCMREGDFEDGQYVVRAKIDMASPNIHMRDPAIYRIKRIHHYRHGDKWCIYPTYDFAHCLEDSIENITHSLCTLEFEVHRPLYDWILDALDVYHPRQIEFARLNLSYTVMSKRKLLELVEGGHVNGWDDPRLPTIAGLRRRGFTPAAIREFCKRVGITKFDGLTDISLLEYCIRDELNKTAPRAMAVLNPVKLVITNYPEGQDEELEGINNPEDPAAGTRVLPFSRELYVEREDVREEAPKKFFRLVPGREVRLRYAYLVTCDEVIKDPVTGEVTEVRCTYDPDTRGGNAPDGRKVRGTIHWVSAAHALDSEMRLYDRLFMTERPDEVKEGEDFKSHLNPDSLETITAKVEPSLRDVDPGTRCQFERKCYAYIDPIDSQPGAPVFNRIVPLRDSWAKIAAKG